jgi:hypothetical protein
MTRFSGFLLAAAICTAGATLGCGGGGGNVYVGVGVVGPYPYGYRGPGPYAGRPPGYWDDSENLTLGPVEGPELPAAAETADLGGPAGGVAAGAAGEAASR